MNGRTGRIITFYSYKGGTGRSMSLANAAWALASAGKRVLVVDWDLEAPGLHRYFRPFLLDRELASTRGLIDMIWEFSAAAMTPAGEEPGHGSDSTPWFEPFTDFHKYLAACRWPFPSSGAVHLLPAGRQGPGYAARVNTFNWQAFYERLGGGAFLDRVFEKMRAEYDYVLIDSRTGVSDTAGVCTVQLPDDVVVCFTSNNQSIDGAAAVSASVKEQWEATRRSGRRLFPMLCRTELGEKDKLESRRAFAKRRFGPLLEHLSVAEQERYWSTTEVLYVPWYAYEEVLAAFGDDSASSRSSMAAPVDALLGYVTRGEYRPGPRPEAIDRERIRADFSRADDSEELDIFVSAPAQHRELVRDLGATLTSNGRFRVKSDVDVVPGSHIGKAIETWVRCSRLVVIIVDEPWGDFQKAELEVALAAAAGGKRKIVPVLVGKATGETLPPQLRQLQSIDARALDATELAARIEAVLRPAAGRPNAPSGGDGRFQEWRETILRAVAVKNDDPDYALPAPILARADDWEAMLPEMTPAERGLLASSRSSNIRRRWLYLAGSGVALTALIALGFFIADAKARAREEILVLRTALADAGTEIGEMRATIEHQRTADQATVARLTAEHQAARAQEQIAREALDAQLRDKQSDILALRRSTVAYLSQRRAHEKFALTLQQRLEQTERDRADAGALLIFARADHEACKAEASASHKDAQGLKLKLEAAESALLDAGVTSAAARRELNDCRISDGQLKIELAEKTNRLASAEKRIRNAEADAQAAEQERAVLAVEKRNYLDELTHLRMTCGGGAEEQPRQSPPRNEQRGAKAN